MANNPQCGHGGSPWPLLGSRNRRRIRRGLRIRGQPRFGLRTLGMEVRLSPLLYGLRFINRAWQPNHPQQTVLCSSAG